MTPHPCLCPRPHPSAGRIFERFSCLKAGVWRADCDIFVPRGWHGRLRDGPRPSLRGVGKRAGGDGDKNETTLGFDVWRLVGGGEVPCASCGANELHVLCCGSVCGALVGVDLRQRSKGQTPWRVCSLSVSLSLSAPRAGCPAACYTIADTIAPPLAKSGKHTAKPTKTCLGREGTR